jgi:hypothetical protein
MFDIGDLVTIKSGNEYDSYHKTYGIVIKTKILGARESRARDCQAVQVHWANYGLFWDTSIRLKKVIGVND